MSHPTLLLTGQDREALVRKFTASPSPVLQRMWRHFLLLAGNNPHWFSTYSVLAWLVTGEAQYRAIARENFLSLARQAEQGMVCDEVQNHTHTATAPLVHNLVFYDWIHGTGLLTTAEETFFADQILDFAFQTALVQLRGRAPGFDNQVFANAAGAAVTGHVIGRRHGHAGRARVLYETGQTRLLDQLGRLTDACYSHEGSTYHTLIVLPLITLAAAFVEECAGIPAYAEGVGAGVPARDWIVGYERMIGPGGLLPGWDQYGNMRATVKLPLAYRARRDGCGAPLAQIAAADMWYPLCLSMWEMADRVWTLAWWDETLERPTSVARADWLTPPTAGAVHNGAVRLFQYWDTCGAAPHAGRPHANPNALQIDHDGLPLLLDGAPAIDPRRLAWNVPVMRAHFGAPMLEALAAGGKLKLTEQNVPRRLQRAIAGCIGESNSLIIDGEDWYVPLHAAHGRGLACHTAGQVKLIVSDAADIYRDRFDLTQCIRHGLLVDDRYVVSVDRVVADTPHRLTWQAFTWPGVERRGNDAVAVAATVVRIDILPPSAARLEVTAIAGFPHAPCDASSRVRLTLPQPVRAATIPVCLYLQETVETIADCSDGWELAGASVDLNTFFLHDNSATGTQHDFRRTLTCCTADVATGLVLRLAGGGPTTRLQVNGRDVPPAFVQDSPEVQGSSYSFPLVFSLDDVLRDGINELCLSTVTFHGESLRGPLLLQRRCAVHTPRFEVIDDTSLRVLTPDGWDQIHVGNGDRCAWLGGTIRAAAAVRRADGRLALLGVTDADIPALSLRVRAAAPVDIACRDDDVRLTPRKSAPPTDICLRGATAHIGPGPNPAITATTPLTVRVAAAAPVLGAGQAPAANPMHANAPLAPEVGQDCSVAADALTAEALYRHADAGGDADWPALVRAALAADDWRVQVAGADLAARFGLTEAVPELLRLLAAEEKKLPYPPCRAHWARSKMNNALNPGVDHSPDPHLDPVRDANRGRLRQAIIRALGQLGDRRACSALRRVLELGQDHFLTLAQAPPALAALQDLQAIPLLETLTDYFEVNVRRNACLALEHLRSPQHLEIAGGNDSPRVPHE